MIVIRIELWPQGDSTKIKKIANAVIINDATGTFSKGNYAYCLYGKLKKLKDGRVLGFNRRRDHVWKLLKLVLEDYTSGK